MNIFHGSILSCNESNTIYEYLVEEHGRIVYVGDTLPAQYAQLPVTELGKRALIPSFVDTHMHFASFATFHAGLNVMQAKNNAEIISELKDFAASYHGKIVIGFGASPYSVEEKRLVTRTELDSACPDKPVMVVKYDGHACIVNTALLNLIKDKASSLRGYHADTGEMNQEAFFEVSNYITNSLSVLDLIGNMQKAIDYVASKGIGMVHTVSGVGFPKDLDVDLERYVGRGASGGFQMRVFFQTMDVQKALKRKLPRIGGCFATALDGCYGSQDAAMNAPYIGTDNSGVLYYSNEQVTDFCKKANRAGLQIEMHAIGDAAFDQATRALKAALDDFPRKDHRHGIIHACLPTKEGLQICQDYQIQIPLQTSFINWPQEPDSYLSAILGKERNEQLNPLRTFINHQLLISGGSDAPCTDPDPILWMHNACNHSVSDQSLSVFEALRMCTYNGYYATFDEKERGTLEKGKIADMVILSDNPYEIPKEQLINLKVEQLYLNGEPYRNQSDNKILMALKGLCSKRKV